MTNLEMLIKSDSGIRQRMIEIIISEFCIDPVKMKENNSCKCEKCFFASGKYMTCDENKIMEWLQQEQNIAERKEAHELHGQDDAD